jgi:hypothetical protein
MAGNVEAGQGDHHIYPIFVAGGDATPLTANTHYLGIDAVSWFVNKSGGWFSSRTASGTLSMTLVDGLESYAAALGTFELKDGARVAPVFDKPVLPDRNYRGSGITIGASLVAIKRDTTLTSILKSAASASLGIVSGMVQTASLGGPQQILAAAGGSLISGVNKLLSEESEGREPLFAGGGIETTIQPGQFVGERMYLLFHRGSALAQAKLGIGKTGTAELPYYDGNPLEDGAWLLLRLRRSLQYSGVRDWFAAERALRTKVDNIVSDFQQQVLGAQAALAQLMPSANGSSTAFDEFIGLRRIIQVDGVLSEKEAVDRVAALAAHVADARTRIRSAAPRALESARLESPDGDLVTESRHGVLHHRASVRPIASEAAVGELPVRARPLLM